jgi:hypothetical protein
VPGVTTWFNLPALIIMLILTAMLSWGVRESARVNNVMVAIKVGVVLLFIVVGARHVQPANWQPFMPFGVGGMMSAAALVFFAFIGFDAVTSAAEEVKRPERDLPIGIIGSLAACTVLYVLVSAIMTGIVPFQKFLGIDHPVSLALQYAGENWVAGFVDLGAILGMTTVILVMTYGQTRIIFAMSRDGLLPKKLSDRAPEIRHAVLRYLGGRHCIRPDCRHGAAECADGADQYRHPGRLLPGVDRRGRPAQKASRPAARLPLPGRAGDPGAGRDLLRRADDLPALADLDRLRNLAPDRTGDIFYLCTSPFCIEPEGLM